MYTFRPANMTEAKGSYVCALQADKPSNIILSRQTLVNFDSNVDNVKYGGYIASSENKGELNGVIIATGSEMGLALDVKKLLADKGYNIRVVSMPCVELFEEQSARYRDSVIPENMKSIFSIEAGSTCGWYKYVGKYGKCFGVDDFGASAKPNELYSKFGLTSDSIAKEISAIIRKNRDKKLTLF